MDDKKGDWVWEMSYSILWRLTVSQLKSGDRMPGLVQKTLSLAFCIIRIRTLRITSVSLRRT